MNGLPTNPDVVVVGAGAAGLSAAKSLKNQGFDVVVVEAAAHVGGRCITDASIFDIPFDLGGSWLHSAAINPLARLAEQHGVELHKSDWNWKWVHSNGTPLTPPQVVNYNQYQHAMWQAVNDAGAGLKDVTVEQSLPKSPWKDTAKHWVSQMLGGDADVTSAADVYRYADAQGDWLVASGLGAFVKGLHSDVDVVLNCPVSKIDYSGAGVRVVTTQGTIAAKCVVLTVSTGVLAAENIEFVPRLPTPKVDALHKLPVGLLNKVGLDFDAKWQEAYQGQTADYMNGEGEFCTFLFGFYDTNLAVGFVAGSFADQLEKQGASAATDFCLEGLQAIFGSDITKHIRRTTETAWRSNANTLGSYSYAVPGGTDARATLAGTLDDRVYFAGEATMVDAQATVHGAYLSGIEVAKKIAATHR
ncbi:MAG: monoamine oxidase [Paracoccaceae bacterium]